MKIAVNTTALFTAGLVLLGFYSDFLANEEILIFFIYVGLGFSLLIVIPVLVKIAKEKSTYTQKMQDQGKSPLLGIVAIAVMIPVFVVAAFYKGLPAALNYIVGSPGVIEVTIRSKPSGYFDKFCPGGVDLQEYVYFLNDRICGVGETDWRGLRKWDKLVLVGTKSLFGIHFYEYKTYQRGKTRKLFRSTE